MLKSQMSMHEANVNVKLQLRTATQRSISTAGVLTHYRRTEMLLN
uniref:Uncharacterized protein n=1 Tax=Anguilla anguilla TaxID=7936 RepID=A0A0E9U947_ANGAN